MRYSASNGGSAHRKRFLDATKAAMKTWKFRPELIAGQIAPGRMTIPVMFCMDIAWCQAREREDAMAKASQLPLGLNMASESAVVLKTRIGESGGI
jgi:hypothetical protein